MLTAVNWLYLCVFQGLGRNLFTEVDFDELGPNLISQLSKRQMSTLVPAKVLVGQLGALKDMCMNKQFSIAVTSHLMKKLGYVISSS